MIEAVPRCLGGPNPLARACKAELSERVRSLSRRRSKNHDRDAEVEILNRVLGFPFEDYPDTTAPWHLLTWPSEHVRWQHVLHIIQIIEGLRQPTGAHVGGGITLQPFQVMIILAFMGPENPETGLRAVREGLLTLSRKNAKTTTVAGLVTALMALRKEDHGYVGQDIQVGASDREQAGITYGMIDRFIHMDSRFGLQDSFIATPSRKVVRHRRTLTTLRCLSSEAYRQHGGNPALVLLDELGNLGNSLATEYYSVLTTGFGAQIEPLTLLFSTQAASDQHLFSTQVDLAKRINEGMVAPGSFAGFVFSTPERDEDGEDIDPYDEKWWYLSNPGIDTIVNRDALRDFAKKAKELPALEQKFRLLHLNQRVSETSSLISRSVWTMNKGRSWRLDDLYGRRCWLGADLSQTTDLTALVAVFEPDDDDQNGVMPVIPFFWCPGNDLDGRARRDNVPYRVWVEQGYLDASSATTVDYELVAGRIIELIENCDVGAIGFDRYRMRYLSKALKDRGYEWDKEDKFLIEIGQGFVSQTRSVELLESRLLACGLAHGGHPVLTWNAGNVVVARDPAGNRKFEKAKSYGRIDGIVALSLALHARDELGVSGAEVSAYASDDFYM